MLWGKVLYSVCFSFVRNRSCVTQICITKIAGKCILVVVVKWRHHANVLLATLESEKERDQVYGLNHHHHHKKPSPFCNSSFHQFNPDLDPCINVTCNYYAVCKAFGGKDARCVCVEKCPSYEEPVCSSNGTTYDNECLYKRDMCHLEANFTMYHPGSCTGKWLFSVQRY